MCNGGRGGGGGGVRATDGVFFRGGVTWAAAAESVTRGFGTTWGGGSCHLLEGVLSVVLATYIPLCYIPGTYVYTCVTVFFFFLFSDLFCDICWHTNIEI